jgi:hypothetical protein
MTTDTTNKYIFDFKPDLSNVHNFDTQFQITILKGNKGDKIQRHMISDQQHIEKLETHPDNEKVINNLTQYFFVKGNIKFYSQWRDDENITQNDIDFILSLGSDYAEQDYAKITQENNRLNIEIDMGDYVKQWSDKSNAWQLKTDVAGIEALEDDTILVCCIQNDFSWKFKNVDLKPGDEIETLKIGNDCYLFNGGQCELKVPSIDVIGEVFTYDLDPFQCKKIKSPKLTIKNTSDSIQRHHLIWR